MSRRLPTRRSATHSRLRMRTTITRALRFLVTVDRDKRIDRHIDYFGSGAALAVGVSRDRGTHCR